MPESHHRSAKVSVSTVSIFKLVLAVSLVFLLYYIRDVLVLILLAVVIASAVGPAAEWLGKFRIKRTPAVFLVYLVFFILLGLIVYFFIPAIISEGFNLLGFLPQYLTTFQAWAAKSATFLNHKLDFGIPTDLGLSAVIAQIKTSVVGSSPNAIGFALNFFGGFFQFILVFILSFYLAIKKDGIPEFLRIITPLRHQEYAVDIWKRTEEKIGKWVQGQLVLIVIVAALVFLGLLVLGVKHAFLFAVVAGILELIPIFGPFLAAIPATLVGFAQGGLTLGLLVVGFFVIIQQFESNLIYPMVFNKLVGIPSIVVIIAFIIGAKIAGLLGVLLSVPVAAFAMEWVGDLQKRQDSRRAAADQEPGMVL